MIWRRLSRWCRRFVAREDRNHHSTEEIAQIFQASKVAAEVVTESTKDQGTQTAASPTTTTIALVRKPGVH